MNLHGYISFADVASNMQDRVTIRGYADSSTGDVSEPYSEYVFDKTSRKLISMRTEDKAYLPYTKATWLLDEALVLDKKQLHNVSMTFTLPEGRKPTIKIARIVKELFPLPHKSITYLPLRTFINVTSYLAGTELLTNLEASLYADHYNNIAIHNGFLEDRMFEWSCGRVFMLADEAMRSLDGRRLLKSILGENYATVRSCCNVRAVKMRFRGKPCANVPIADDSYSNNFLQAHCIAANRLAELTFENALTNPLHVSELVQKQLEIYQYEFERDYYKHLVEKTYDYQYLCIRDILRLHINPDFRVNINKHIAIARKIYNANSSRGDFVCIMSNGKIVGMYDCV